jgi:hypothetical protein
MDRFKIWLAACALLFCCAGPETVEEPRAVAAEASEPAAAPTMPPPSVAAGIIPDEPLAQPMKVGGDVKAPIVKRRVEPKIAYDRSKNYYQGLLMMEAIVDENGRVRSVRALNHQSGPFTQNYVDALAQWEFDPATLDGKPVPVVFNLTVNHFPVKEAP